MSAGRMLPFNLPELEVSGLALVTAIKDCTPIADGEGSVVTARFVTREVHVVASVDVLGADGTVETITGTTIHPVWSVDRQEWVPLAELAQGERLCCDTESFGLCFPSSLSPKASGLVLSVSLSRVSQPVYNIEVHGEHVYQVGELGVVVHNAYLGTKTVTLSKLVPNGQRPFADAAKLAAQGKFEMAKYTHPIEVILRTDGRYEIMDGMTRFENALKAGIKELPVKVFIE
jgi:hypothetical protein